MSMLVGYTAGAVVVLPFDRIKSLMQVSDASRQQGATGVARTIIASQGFFKIIGINDVIVVVLMVMDAG